MNEQFNELNKSKVVRLKKNEQKLINYLREEGEQKLIKEIRNILEKLNSTDTTELRKVLSMVDCNPLYDIETLIETDFIRRDQADYILEECINNNKSIVITGRAGVGKTTLLKALLQYNEKYKFLIYDRYKEEFSDLRSIDNNILLSVEEIGLKEIAMLNSNNKLVLSEMSTKEAILGFISALNVESSVIGTMQTDDNFDIKNEILSELTGDMRKHAEETLEGYPIVQVSISRENGRRFVSEIKELNHC